MVVHGQKAEKGVCAGDKRHGDSQHIVDKKGAAGNNARLFTNGVCCHDVSAASVGKVLDDTRVGVRYDDDGERSCNCKKDGKVSMLPQCPEGFFRPVRGRREPVGPEPYPGQQRNETKLVENGQVFYVLRRADYSMAGLRKEGPVVLIIICHMFLPFCSFL